MAFAANLKIAKFFLDFLFYRGRNIVVDINLGQVIDCCKCKRLFKKEDFEWDEPKGYKNTNLMPNGTFTAAAPGEWMCLDCSYCLECNSDLLQNECICEKSTI
jgi:hypothetical protein